MKKMLSTLLALVLTLTLLSLPACAAATQVPAEIQDPVNGDRYSYSYNGTTLAITEQYKDPYKFYVPLTASLPFLFVDNKADQNVILASLYDRFESFLVELPFVFSPLVKSGRINTVSLSTYYGDFTMKFTLDSKGRVSKVSRSDLSEPLRLKYDTKSRLVSAARGETDSLKVTYGPNDSVNALQILMEDNRMEAKCSSDKEGRVVKAQIASMNDATNRFGYTDGKLTSITITPFYDPAVMADPTVTITKNGSQFYRNKTLLPVQSTNL